MGKHRDWTEIEKDYQENGLSYAALARKHGIPLDTLKKAAARQHWTRKKERKAKGMLESIKAAVPEVEIEPQMAQLETAPPETALPETALPEMAPAEFTVRDGESRAQRFLRLTDEMAGRIEDALVQVDVSNAYAIKLLAGALKDLRDLQGLNKSALDIEEQHARIAKLRSETRIYEPEGSGGIVLIPTIDDTLLPPGGDDDG